MKVHLYIFFNVGARWVWVVNTAPRHQGKSPVIHTKEGWVGLGAGLDGCGKFAPHRDSKSDLSIPYCLVLAGVNICWLKIVLICGISSSLLDIDVRGVHSFHCDTMYPS